MHAEHGVRVLIHNHFFATRAGLRYTHLQKVIASSYINKLVDVNKTNMPNYFWSTAGRASGVSRRQRSAWPDGMGYSTCDYLSP